MAEQRRDPTKPRDATRPEAEREEWEVKKTDDSVNLSDEELRAISGGAVQPPPPPKPN
jgi:hypothetical protein